MSNTECVRKRPSSKGFAALPIIIIVALVVIVGMFVFGGPPTKQPPDGLSQDEHKEWIAEKVYEGIYTHEMIDLGYEVPTQKELEQLRQQTSLERVYPGKVNAIFEVGANLATLLHLDGELKDLGVNTYFVQAEYEQKWGKPQIFEPESGVFVSQEKAKRAIKHRMLMAKEKGFAVGFIPDYPSYFNFGRDKYDINKLEPQYIEVALEWAKIAEEYGLEYFVPVNEYEKLLESNGYDLDFIYEKTNAFYDKLMPQLRGIYSGKIIMKTGHLGDWENHKNLDHTAADLFGVGTYYALSAENIREDFSKMVKVADEISVRDGTPWLVTEYLIATPEDIERDFVGEGIKIDMKDAYEVAISELKKSRRNVGFTFTGYIGTGKIRGTGAVPLLKDYFSR